ncbi:MAG: DHHA1 domain-containing protein [Promethearchaeota archaeon]
MNETNESTFERSLSENMKISKVGILAHGDGDGLASAAIIKTLFPGARVYFSNAVSLARDLRQLLRELGANPRHIFIVDLAINPKSAKRLFEVLSSLPKTCQVHYYDHHELPSGILDNFSAYVSDLVHDVNTSASCVTLRGISQLENLTNDWLSREFLIKYRTMAWLSAFGAISDHKENSKEVRAILDIYDQALLFYQAFSLKNACRKITRERSKREIIAALSAGMLPSEIHSVREAAHQAALEGKTAIDFINTHAIKHNNIAWIINCPVGSMGMNAYMTATLKNAKIGLALRTNGNNIDISIRKQHYQEELDLHKITFKATQAVGGTGGGSPDETGANIPEDKLDDFLELLDSLLIDMDTLRKTKIASNQDLESDTF